MRNKIFLSVLLFPILLKGFGNTTILEIFALLLFSFLFYASESRQGKVFIAISSILFMLSPSIIHLWAILALILLQNKDSWGFAFVAFALIGLEYVYIPTSFLSLSTFYIIGLILNFLQVKRLRILNIVSIIIATLAVVIDVCVIFTKNQTKVEKYNIDSVYSPSNLFCKTTNSEYLSTTDDDNDVIRSLMFNPSVDKERKGIVVHEIQTEDIYGVRHCDSWQQPPSWHHNQLLGGQYLLEAISKDGGLYSNKGVCFENTSCIKLAYPSTWSKSQPLIISVDGITHLHDSDYTSSYLSNYQQSLNNEIMQNGSRPILIRFISIIALLLSIILIFNLENRNKYWGIVHYTVFCMLYFAIFICPRNGDIRIVGKITNSHENHKFDGVPKNIVNAGFDYTLGTLNAKVLVVSSNSFAIWLGEPLVILEPNATVLYKTSIISSNDTPLGFCENIPDARHIEYKDKSYNGYIGIDDVKFISTGSPSKLQWENLLK